MLNFLSIQEYNNDQEYRYEKIQKNIQIKFERRWLKHGKKESREKESRKESRKENSQEESRKEKSRKEEKEITSTFWMRNIKKVLHGLQNLL